MVEVHNMTKKECEEFADEYGEEYKSEKKNG